MLRLPCLLYKDITLSLLSMLHEVHSEIQNYQLIPLFHLLIKANIKTFRVGSEVRLKQSVSPLRHNFADLAVRVLKVTEHSGVSGTCINTSRCFSFMNTV